MIAVLGGGFFCGNGQPNVGTATPQVPLEEKATGRKIFFLGGVAPEISRLLGKKA